MQTLTEINHIAPAAMPGGAGFKVRLAGRGALRALGLSDAPAGVGHPGAALANSSRGGKVLAVFRRSFYLAFGENELTRHALACFVPASSGANQFAGPLNVICDLPEGIDWAASGLRPGDPARVTDGRVVAGRFSFSFEGAEVWLAQAALSGADLPERWRRADVLSGLKTLSALAEGKAPAEGLGRLIPKIAGGAGGTNGVDLSAIGGAEWAGDMGFPEGVETAGDMGGLEGCQTPNGAKRQVICVGGQGALALAGAMSGMLYSSSAGRGIEISSYLTSAAGLVGLGPGLTPSGDDFIGGAMVALRILGRGDIADRLVDWVLPLALAGTSRISRAHLTEAARGEGAGALHGMIEAIVGPVGGDISSRLEAIDAVGHTSGWDALAGAVAAIGAVFCNDMGRDGIAAAF